MTEATATDPKRDCAEIARRIGTVAFPWDTTRSLTDYPQGYRIESLGPPPFDR
jgi:hypothetical protein